MKFWRENVDSIITFNQKALLADKGSVSNAQMEAYADNVYERFNEQRKIHELNKADEDDMNELKRLEENIKNRQQ